MARKSIKKRIAFIFLPMLIFITVITVCIIISMESYNKTFRFYSDEYYKTVNCVVKMNDFMTTVDRYVSVEDAVDYDTLVACYKEELRPACEELYSIRFDFKSIRSYEIEKVYDIINNDISADILQLPNDNQTAYKNLFDDFKTAYNRHMRVGRFLYMYAKVL